jgi:hypothetical protein
MNTQTAISAPTLLARGAMREALWSYPSSFPLQHLLAPYLTVRGIAVIEKSLATLFIETPAAAIER